MRLYENGCVKIYRDVLGFNQLILQIRMTKS